MAKRDDDTPAVIADETSHFPYHADRAREALADPGGDNNHPGSWYTSADIIDSTERYVKAQERRLRNPGDSKAQAAEAEAAKDLQEARAYHRRRRTGPAVITGSVDEAHQAVKDNTRGREG